MHTPERKGVGVLPNEEEPSKEAVTSLIQGSSSGSLFTFGQLPGFFFHTCPALGPSPTGVRNFFPRWIPPQRPMGGPWHHILWGGAPSFLTPKEPFCACAMSPLPQGWEIYYVTS